MPVKLVNPNATEWVLLDTLWEMERGTSREVAERLHSRRGWARSTVKTLLDRMVKKGLVSARQVGNVWEYEPAVEPGDARLSAFRRFVELAFGGSMTPALEFIASDARLTAKQRRALKDLLESGEDDHG